MTTMMMVGDGVGGLFSGLAAADDGAGTADGTTTPPIPQQPSPHHLMGGAD
jgi:hypothetical protein